MTHNAAWSAADVRRMTQMHEAGSSVQDIAGALGRSVQAVKSQLTRTRRRGAGPVKRRVPLHGMDLKRAHPVVRKILAVAAREGYTFRVLADRAGVSRGVIANMVHASPSFGSVVAVAEAVGLTVTVSDNA